MRENTVTLNKGVSDRVRENTVTQNTKGGSDRQITKR